MTPIVPDSKDWTWVLERRCPECGFDTRDVTGGELPRLITENAAVWTTVLADSARDVRVRPSEDRWSVLEYGCHVRDVFRIYDARLRLMLGAEDPEFANWDQDVTAIEDRYLEQNPDEVAQQLFDNAAVLAEDFSGLDPSQWRRPGTRSDGARFDVEKLGRYMIHDTIHHLFDVDAPAVGAQPS